MTTEIPDRFSCREWWLMEQAFVACANGGWDSSGFQCWLGEIESTLERDAPKRRRKGLTSEREAIADGIVLAAKYFSKIDGVKLSDDQVANVVRAVLVGANWPEHVIAREEARVLRGAGNETQ